MKEGLGCECSGRERKQDGNREEVLEPVAITERDVAIFKLIHEQRYVVMNQIVTAFWKCCSEDGKAAKRRVMKLVDTGYLKLGEIRDRKIKVCLLTEKSYGELKSRGLDSGLSLYASRDDYYYNFDHDLKVVNLRILFRDLGLDKWKSERLLKEKELYGKVPDAVLDIHGYQAAIEFENTVKSKERYSEAFHRYKEHSDFFFVFFILDKWGRDWIFDLDYDPQQVWFVLYRDLFEMREETPFVNKEAGFPLSRIL